MPAAWRCPVHCVLPCMLCSVLLCVGGCCALPGCLRPCLHMCMLPRLLRCLFLFCCSCCRGLPAGVVACCLALPAWVGCSPKWSLSNHRGNLKYLPRGSVTAARDTSTSARVSKLFFRFQLRSGGEGWWPKWTPHKSILGFAPVMFCTEHRLCS